jgi:hypothetical protein
MSFPTHRLAALSLVAAGLLAATAAQAEPIVTTVTMSGPAENPPVDSPGTGFGTITLDTDANRLSFDLSFTGLRGTTMMAHIHCCVAPPGVIGVATTLPSLPGFPLGVTFGSYIASLDTNDPSTWNPDFVLANGGLEGAEARLADGMRAGQAYFNIHTSAFPAGEIRGFTVPVAVPEPASFALFGLGLAGLMAARRRPATA